VAARTGTPGLGVLAKATCGIKENSNPKLWTVSLGYRYQQSFRHFVGIFEQKQRELNRNQIYNLYHLFDVGIERQLTPRWSITAGIPLVFSHRNQLYAPSSKQVVNGFGDASLGVRAWIFKPPTESGDNISIGASLKMPTGNYRAHGLAVQSGRLVDATFDQSMMTGDGGTGFSVDISAYKRVPFNTMAYGAALWLFNPRNTNGVSTFRGGRGEETFSVADQYLLRAGFGHSVPKLKGVAGSFGMKMEGVPVRDLLGKSLGFRRPGYVISFDPGVLYAHGLYTLSVNGPWAWKRNRLRSVPDITRGARGDAAFSDFAMLIGLSRRF
jgi:hypothetical protein